MNHNHLAVHLIRTTRNIEEEKAVILIELKSSSTLTIESISYEIRNAIKTASIRILRYSIFSTLDGYVTKESSGDYWERRTGAHLINSVRELNQYLKNREFSTLFDYDIYNDICFSDYSLIIVDFITGNGTNPSQPYLTYYNQSIQIGITVPSFGVCEITFFMVLLQFIGMRIFLK